MLWPSGFVFLRDAGHNFIFGSRGARQGSKFVNFDFPSVFVFLFEPEFILLIKQWTQTNYVFVWNRISYLCLFLEHSGSRKAVEVVCLNCVLIPYAIVSPAIFYFSPCGAVFDIHMCTRVETWLFLNQFPYVNHSTSTCNLTKWLNSAMTAIPPDINKKILEEYNLCLRLYKANQHSLNIQMNWINLLKRHSNISKMYHHLSPRSIYSKQIAIWRPNSNVPPAATPQRKSVRRYDGRAILPRGMNWPGLHRSRESESFSHSLLWEEKRWTDW